MGGPTSSYAAAGIALEFIVEHKPPHTATKCFRQGGDIIKGDLHISIHPSSGATPQIGPWPSLLRFDNNVLRCEVVSLTTNPR
jgi:hypothetical protein